MVYWRVGLMWTQIIFFLNTIYVQQRAGIELFAGELSKVRQVNWLVKARQKAPEGASVVDPERDPGRTGVRWRQGSNQERLRAVSRVLELETEIQMAGVRPCGSVYDLAAWWSWSLVFKSRDDCGLLFGTWHPHTWSHSYHQAQGSSCLDRVYEVFCPSDAWMNVVTRQRSLFAFTQSCITNLKYSAAKLLCTMDTCAT